MIGSLHRLLTPLYVTLPKTEKLNNISCDVPGGDPYPGRDSIEWTKMSGGALPAPSADRLSIFFKGNFVCSIT